ncbi:Microtubule-associated tumor suppressor [Dirofilaria immitis]
MEDCDDGIGSEINTPRDVQHVEQLRHNSTEENENLDAVDDLVAAHSTPSVSASSSTPIRPQNQKIPQHIPGISPIKRVPLTECADDNTTTTLQRVDGETNDGVANQQYTKLDLAMMLRDKHSECIELEGENERLSQLVERLTSENHDFQNQISVTKVCAATLAKETEELKKVVEENELKFRECKCQLRMAEQKLLLLENVSIDIEADKLPDAEMLKKLQDENNTMQAKISELNFKLEIEKEGEKNAEIWRKKYDIAKKDMKEMHKIKIELEKELESKRAEVSSLNKEKKSCDEECSKFKSLYNENAAKVVELQKQLHIIEERSKHLQEHDSKLAELEELKTEKKVWNDEREHLQKEKFGLEKRIEQLALANYELSTEKQALLEADNKGLKDLAAWQEKNKKLTLQNAQLADELKKYRDMDLRLTECLDELTKKDSLIEELNGQITKINDELKRFRDETVYLRTQLNEKTKTNNEMQEDWALEKKKLLSECEHLKEKVAKNRTLVDQIGTDKQRNDELESLLKKRELELNNVRALMDKKQKRIDDLMEEKTDLKHENAHLKTVVDEIKAEYNIFRSQAEVQYQLETAQLNHIIEEKDERLERLHARIALYESYPGQSSTGFSCSVDANSHADITIWDALPASIRSELYELKEKYQDLNALVCRMMSDPPTKQYANTKIMETKSTDCCGLALFAGLSNSKLMDRHDSVCEAGSNNGSPSGSLDVLQPGRISEAEDTLLLMLDSVRHAEIRGKLSPNIQQLLEHLLSDVQEGNKSKEQISGAVSRFFANLDLALRKTLSASDDNRIKCEKLEKLCMEMTADLHDARDELRSAMNKCSMYETDIDSLKLQFRCESQNCAELHGKLKRAFEEIDNLTKQKDDFGIALREAKIMLKRKTDLGSQAADTIKYIKDELNEAKKFEDKMNERLRKLCKEKEKVKQLLSERELDIVKLECRLVESTNECTARASELRQAESKIDELQRRNEYLKRKYDKREHFLEEMETILRALKIRCEGLQGTNQLRQNIIEKLKKLLVKLGCNLDNPYLIGGKKSSVFKSSVVKSMKKSKTRLRPSHLKRLKLAKIAQRFEKDTAKIKDLEKCRGNDIVHVPSWRSLNNNASASPASSRADEELNDGITAGSTH